MSSEAITLPAHVGSVSYVASRLVTWIAHRRPGIVWVEFWSDEIRDRVIEKVNASCRAAQISVQLVGVLAASTRRDWEHVRDRLESSVGVVHVLFPALFNEALLESGTFRDFAIALNLDRERIFSVDASQIWWVSRPFSALIRPLAPDFLSWVHARFTLNELPPVVTATGPSLELRSHLDREVNLGSIPLSQTSLGSIWHIASDDPTILNLSELVRQSDDLLTAGKLREALALAGEAVYGFRQKLAVGEAAESGLAGSLDLLARIQSRLGQRQQALASATEAVRICRALAEANPDAFLPALAGSLNNQANLQSDMGQRAEALASIAEATRHYRALAGANPDAFLPDLALSLNNQANSQSAMGQRAEALASIAESVRHYRALAEANREAFLPALAGSLNNQANSQSAMGQRAEALASIAEAVRIRRALAGANPDAFLPDLAGSLNNQANRQSAMGQRAEALASIAEAVRLCRRLAAANPEAFLPDLAASLNNRANRQSDIGQRAEALASITEAVRIRRALAEANPDAFLPDLAISLSVQGDCLAATKRPLEARNAARESLVHLAPFVARFPGVFDALAKRTLQDYLLRTQDLGEEPEDQVFSPYLDLLKTETQEENRGSEAGPEPT